jgi:hypothetical protein
MATDLTPNITQGASDPASFATDGQSVSSKPIDQLIAADVYAGTGKSNVNKRRRGLFFSKMTAPGAFSDNGGARVGYGFGCGGW